MYPLARRILPKPLRVFLWGDREKWGYTASEFDADWKAWLDIYEKFYLENQRSAIGRIINDAGYKVMKKIDISSLEIMEIGPADIRHIDYWIGRPRVMYLVDNLPILLLRAHKLTAKNGIKTKLVTVTRESVLPLPSESIDLVITFYSLEHIYPLDKYLQEVNRILKPGGRIVGAIPTEGSLVWGLGRFFTSRRWFLRNTSLNPDKIISWEHPNFGDFVIDCLDEFFERESLVSWPFNKGPYDVNFILKFIYKKRTI
jgi:SAM-dependent methyltransferase